MELTEKNGHASIEEILASVRRIIAEEPGSSAPLIDISAPSHHPRGDGLLDDPSDFDLPSMFRTPSPAASADRPAPLFGRLSEAIRAASNGQGQSADAARANQSLSTLKLHRADAGDAGGAPHFLLSTFHETTTPRADELAAAAAPEPTPEPGSSSQTFATGPAMSVPDAGHSPSDPYASFERSEQPQPAAPSAASAAPQVPRQMAAFKDTRFRGMGSSPVAIDPQPFVSPFEAIATAALVSAADMTAAPAPGTVAAAFEMPAPALMAAVEDLVAVEAPPGLTAAIVASYPALAHDHTVMEPAAPISPPASPSVSPAVPPPVPAQPPSAPAASAADGAGPIEDSTADLLRPMLRQWLAENMPRMVEKALHIEVAESNKTTKK